MIRMKSLLLATISAISLFSVGNLSAQDGIIATVNPPMVVADRHEDPRSSWRQSNNRSYNSSRPTAQPYLRNYPDQGYYYWNQQYFAGRPNFYDRPYYYYYYDPKYYYDDNNNGSVKYYPNY